MWPMSEHHITLGEAVRRQQRRAENFVILPVFTKNPAANGDMASGSVLNLFADSRRNFTGIARSFVDVTNGGATHDPAASK